MNECLCWATLEQMDDNGDKDWLKTEQIESGDPLHWVLSLKQGPSHDTIAWLRKNIHFFDFFFVVVDVQNSSPQ